MDIRAAAAHQEGKEADKNFIRNHQPKVPE